jgi:hypothetical protein
MANEELRLEAADLTEVGRVRDLYALLKAIDIAMPKEATLYVEGTSIGPEVRVSSRDLGRQRRGASSREPRGQNRRSCK